MSGAFAVLLFITGIPLAVYANEWDDEMEVADSLLEGALKEFHLHYELPL